MPLTPRPTIEPETLVKYSKRARWLIQRCRRLMKLSPHETLDDRRLVGWLISYKPHISARTWRQYKASVRDFLERKTKASSDPIAEEALAMLLPVGSEGTVRASRKTSGSKLKKFPARDFRRILEYLNDHPSRWSEDLERWLISGLLTGLRPVEWGQARWGEKDGEPALIVRNAKDTNERAHGRHRTLLLGGLTDEERELIQRHTQRAVDFFQAGEYVRFNQGCASTLSRAARQIWPRRGRYPSLYSLRHQFSADAKASGLTREELAALMGHAVDTTATQHYGRRSAGLEMVRVRPAPEEVARIRQMFRQRFEAPEPTPKLQNKPNAPRLRPNEESGNT